MAGTPKLHPFSGCPLSDNGSGQDRRVLADCPLGNVCVIACSAVSGVPKGIPLFQGAQWQVGFLGLFQGARGTPRLFVLSQPNGKSMPSIDAGGSLQTAGAFRHQHPTGGKRSESLKVVGGLALGKCTENTQKGHLPA